MLASVSRRGSLRGTEGEVQRMDVDANEEGTYVVGMMAEAPLSVPVPL